MTAEPGAHRVDGSIAEEPVAFGAAHRARELPSWRGRTSYVPDPARGVALRRAVADD